MSELRMMSGPGQCPAGSGWMETQVRRGTEAGGNWSSLPCSSGGDIHQSPHSR